MNLTLTAEQLFRQAYENRYTWDENFSGYEADVTMKTGDVSYTGKVKIVTKGKKYTYIILNDGTEKLVKIEDINESIFE